MAKIEHLDRGMLFALNCPECKEMSAYHAWEEIDYSPIYLKMLFSFDKHTWTLKCKNCKHTIRVHEEEGKKLQPALEARVKFEEGQINEEALLEVVGLLSCIAEVVNQAHNWECPTCAEKIECNLQVCWNCNAPNPIYDGVEKPKNPKIEFVEPGG
jgi:hypothetical protein